LDSITAEIIDQNEVSPSPSSPLPKLRSSARQHRKRMARPALRPVRSKLDLLDSKHFTSFPLEPPVSDRDSIFIVEDYITSDNIDFRSDKVEVEPLLTVHSSKKNEAAKTTGDRCINCCRSMNTIHSIFSGSGTGCYFLCLKCMELDPEITQGFSSVAKIEGEEASNFEPYYVLEKMDSDWYIAFRRKFRWRWRLRGLLR